MKKNTWRNIMQNINWGNLIRNILRCIIAYPLFLIAFVISIPFNVVCYLFWIGEFVLEFICFIFTGEFSFLKYSSIGELIMYHTFCDLIFVVFPATVILIMEIDDFNNTLYPIKRSYNEVDRMDVFKKTLEEIKRS